METFHITRINEEKTDYFVGFLNKYDIERKIEEYGIEKWNENLSWAKDFDSYVECKKWFDVLNKDKEHNTYEIVLYRYATEEEIIERNKECDCKIPLKTFYTTDEE